MEELNFVDMPDEYCQLLKVDMSTTSKFHTGLQSYILKHPSLMGIVNRILSRGEEVDVHSSMKKLGWHGVRDRILTYYVNLATKKIHITNADFDTIDDILSFEQELRFSTVSGFSRLILFGFYMKLDCLERGIEDLKDHPLYPDEKIISYLQNAQEKIINIDFVLILLKFLISNLGEDKFDAYLSQNYTFESLYMNLNELQKDNLCRNFLSYCSSINEVEVFTTKIV